MPLIESGVRIKEFLCSQTCVPFESFFCDTEAGHIAELVAMGTHVFGTSWLPPGASVLCVLHPSLQTVSVVVFLLCQSWPRFSDIILSSRACRVYGTHVFQT